MARYAFRLVAFVCAVVCAAAAALEIVSAGHRLRTDDCNRDGRPDVWREYDSRGRLIRVEIDSNFDGRPDIAEYYERGVLVRRESDRNFNGQIDLLQDFDPDTHRVVRSVADVDYDGVADLLTLFRDGRPVFSEPASALHGGATPARRAVAARRPTDVLAGLTDPFETETVVRAVRVASPAVEWVGLTTPGGLPSPREVWGAVSASGRPTARDGAIGSQQVFLDISPRAPPVS